MMFLGAHIQWRRGRTGERIGFAIRHTDFWVEYRPKLECFDVMRRPLHAAGFPTRLHRTPDQLEAAGLLLKVCNAQP